MNLRLVIAFIAVCASLAQGQVMANGEPAPKGLVITAQPDQVIFGFSPFGNQQLILNGTTVVNATKTGWYNDIGFHDSGNNNYIAGFCCGSRVHRDFFVFAVPNLGTTITSATLSIGNPSNGYISPNPSDTYSVFDVSTAIPTLIATQSGRVDIFNDLGSGTLYASRSVDASTDGTQVQITLNAQAVAALNAAQGSQFAFGGALNASTVPSVPIPPTLLLTLFALTAICIFYAWRTNRVQVQ